MKIPEMEAKIYLRFLETTQEKNLNLIISVKRIEHCVGIKLAYI
jgi:hypothetical protein